jgi:hypothetical protein
LSRGLSSTIKTALAGSNYYLAILGKFEFNSTYYFTNASTTITYSSNDYVSTGLFLDIGDLEENSRFTTGGISIEFTSVETTILLDLLNNGHTDNPVTLYFALLDADNAIIDAPFEIFAGNVNDMSVSEKMSSSILRLNVTNHWSKLDQIGGRYITDRSQQRFFSGDKCFDRANQTGKRLEWGIEE